MKRLTLTSENLKKFFQEMQENEIRILNEDVHYNKSSVMIKRIIWDIEKESIFIFSFLGCQAESYHLWVNADSDIDNEYDILIEKFLTYMLNWSNGRGHKYLYYTEDYR
jgi:hypothetical protein